MVYNSMPFAPRREGAGDNIELLQTIKNIDNKKGRPGRI
tara:strand:- start:372 stop:488 length:117 start_codon:yes stop_codon:yes gene_type:complete